MTHSIRQSMIYKTDGKVIYLICGGFGEPGGNRTHDNLIKSPINPSRIRHIISSIWHKATVLLAKSYPQINHLKDKESLSLYKTGFCTSILTVH